MTCIDLRNLYPGFQDFDRALEAIVFLLISYLKTLILEPWLPEPDLQDLARVMKADIFLLIH